MRLHHIIFLVSRFKVQETLILARYYIPINFISIFVIFWILAWFSNVRVNIKSTTGDNNQIDVQLEIVFIVSGFILWVPKTTKILVKTCNHLHLAIQHNMTRNYNWWPPSSTISLHTNKRTFFIFFETEYLFCGDFSREIYYI